MVRTAEGTAVPSAGQLPQFSQHAGDPCMPASHPLGQHGVAARHPQPGHAVGPGRQRLAVGHGFPDQPPQQVRARVSVTKPHGNGLGFMNGGNRWLDQRVEHVGQALERSCAACIRCLAKAVRVEPNQVRRGVRLLTEGGVLLTEQTGGKLGIGHRIVGLALGQLVVLVLDQLVVFDQPVIRIAGEGQGRQVQGVDHPDSQQMQIRIDLPENRQVVVYQIVAEQVCATSAEAVEFLQRS